MALRASSVGATSVVASVLVTDSTIVLGSGAKNGKFRGKYRCQKVLPFSVVVCTSVAGSGARSGKHEGNFVPICYLSQWTMGPKMIR